MTKQIQNVDAHFELDTFKAISALATSFQASWAFPKQDTKEQMIVKIQAWREMGLPPVKALNSFYFIQGKVALYGSARTELLGRHGYRIKWIEDTAEKVTAEISKDWITNTLSFSIEELKLMWKGSNPVYTKYPRRFLKHKLLNEFCTTTAWEIFWGFPIIDELEAKEDQEKKQAVVNLDWFSKINAGEEKKEESTKETEKEEKPSQVEEKEEIVDAEVVETKQV